MFTTNDTCTLANVIIANLIHANFFSQVIFFQGMVMTIIAQAKVVLYHDQYLEDDFTPLTIEIFECLH